MSVLVLIEIDNGAIRKTSQEAIVYGAAVAKQLGTSTTVLSIGTINEGTLSAAGSLGATKIIHATDSRLDQENSQAYATVLAQVATQENSKVIILAKSGLGDAVAARTAAKLKAAVVSGVTELPDTTDGFKVTRAIYTGKAFATVSVTSDIKILAIRKNTIEISETGAPVAVTPISPVLNDTDFVAKVTEVEKTSTELSLTDADIIVSGGRGMKGPENWKPLEDLAAALGAATGCSKPVSDLDWRPHHEHIGQTGIKVAPNLYIACGISGAIQHLAGVNASKCIVVINKDPEAPFFKAADYGIVGDVFDVLPRLTKAVEASK
jgi:electron transfer flavoprotein alpha subunit